MAALMALPGDDSANDRAARWLAAWDGQGIHRTATEGDNAGAEWLADEAAALGADVSIEEFSIERLDPIHAYLEIEGQRLAAVPAFDAPPTDAEGIAGRLRLIAKADDSGRGADIVVAELGPLDVHSGDVERLRRAGEHRGFVILCTSEQPGLALLNAERFRTPYGAPAIHVSGEARAAIFAAAAAGASARLVAQSRRVTASARNVVATLPGEQPGPPLVVMTPRSSWWQSTSERGGGIVCWLESLRALLTAPSTRRVIFTANTGHELGHLGLDEFLAQRPGLDRPIDAGGATWVHYGANIGAAESTLKVMSPFDDLRDLFSAELARVAQPCDLATKTTVPNGETRDIQLAGGHCVALVGDNKLFHLPQDRWPDAVDLAAVSRIAGAAARVALALACDTTLRATAADAPPMRVIHLPRSANRS